MKGAEDLKGGTWVCNLAPCPKNVDSNLTLSGQEALMRERDGRAAPPPVLPFLLPYFIINDLM